MRKEDTKQKELLMPCNITDNKMKQREVTATSKPIDNLVHPLYVSNLRRPMNLMQNIYINNMKFTISKSECFNPRFM